MLALAAFLLRIVIPIDAYVLGFQSLFDLPQYLSFFIIGTVAARGDWLMKMPSPMVKRFFVIALVSSGTLLIQEQLHATTRPGQGVSSQLSDAFP